jgi:hypothetical protein
LLCPFSLPRQDHNLGIKRIFTDQTDKNTPDLSASFTVESLETFSEVKKYFSRLSPRKDGRFVWCSVILAQSISFADLMDKTKHSLDNNSLSLWPKASDHELATEVGWLLYPMRQQDESHIAEMILLLAGETIGVKWHSIRTTAGYNRKQDEQDDSKRVYALHLEVASDRARHAREKLKQW